MQILKANNIQRLVTGIQSAARLLSLGGICALSFQLNAFAFDPDQAFDGEKEPQNIVRYGMTALKNGHVKKALDAFRYGAEKNNLASQWKLARMLQLGSHMAQNDLAAYRLYEKIVQQFGDRISWKHERAYVSNAMIQLAHYHQVGIEGSAVRVNYRLSEDYLLRAAALFHDPEAQYQLGALYRRGDLGAKKPRHAARWFGLSARKGHAMAQAQLGEMLFYGDGVPKNPVRGLVLMTRAMDWSAHNTLDSIRTMREQAFAKANLAQRQAVEKIMASVTRLKRKTIQHIPFGPPVAAHMLGEKKSH